MGKRYIVFRRLWHIVLGGCLLAACASTPTTFPMAPSMLTPTGVIPLSTTTHATPTTPATTPATPTTPATTPAPTETALPDALDRPSPTVTPEPPAAPTESSAKPSILSFVSTAYEVASQEPFTLTWETIGEETNLCSAPLELLECVTVPASGSQTLAGGVAGEKTQYALVVKSGVDEERGQITIATRCLHTWHAVWSIAEGDLGSCPSTPYTPSAGAIQRFEHGVMIWLATSQEIFVFCDSARSSATYLRVVDAWREGMPDQDPDLVPPAGSYQPVRGFGLVWRTETLDGRSLREELGWAIEPESGFETAIQCALIQTKWGRYENCYILGQNQNVYETMAPYGVWKKWPLE